MREGVPVFFHHLMPQLGTQSLREQKGLRGTPSSHSDHPFLEELGREIQRDRGAKTEGQTESLRAQSSAVMLGRLPGARGMLGEAHANAGIKIRR